jgi:hypothetical protein
MLANWRWLVPDPAGLAAVDPTNPQTWNRYAYVGNNPLRNVDPLGLKELCAGNGSKTGDCDPVFRYGSTDLFGGIGSLNVLLASGGNTGINYVPPSSTSTVVDFDSAANGGQLDVTQQSFAGLSFSPGYFADSSWSGFSIYSGGSGLGSSSPGTGSGGGTGGGGSALHLPRQVSAYYPIPALAALTGPSVTTTFFPDGSKCVGGAWNVSTPGAKAVSGGLLANGDLSNAKNVVSGWGWTFGIQLTPSIGYTLQVNSSGVVGGPSASFEPGVIAGYGYTWCK